MVEDDDEDEDVDDDDEDDEDEHEGEGHDDCCARQSHFARRLFGSIVGKMTLTDSHD